MAICQFASAQRTRSTEPMPVWSSNHNPQVSVDRGRERDTIPQWDHYHSGGGSCYFKTTEQNISDDQVLSADQVLNKDFRRLNADAVNTFFFHASFSDQLQPIAGSCLPGTNSGRQAQRKVLYRYTDKDFFLGMMPWNIYSSRRWWCLGQQKYLNIWVCLFGRSLGYTTPQQAADLDGVVTNFDVFGTRGIVRFRLTRKKLQLMK